MDQEQAQTAPGQLRTRQDVRDYFESRGETVTEWANTHGFKRDEVYAFLAGRTKGRRGRAHRLAVALRIKPPPPSF